jgi:ATP-dependent RNA helicase RhlE
VTLRAGKAGLASVRESTPLTEFASLGLAETTLRAIAAAGYTTPTDIQRQAIPAILDGADIVGSAQTGTGKTAAFVLPMLDRLAAYPGKPAPNSCKALILAPTRELAQQIGEAIGTYGRNQRLSHTVIVGGAKYAPQIKALSRGVDVLIATPGRLEDHVEAGRISLSGTRIAVLDEADQMLDLGFLPAIKRLLGAMPSARQTLLFSATMPRAIRQLSQQFLTEPREITVAGARDPVAQISQQVRLVEASGKRAVLMDILSDPEVARSIVFTRTKRGADKISEHLESGGLAAAAIHGDKSQRQRERTLNAFRRDRIKVLVATDVAARGIDIDDVSHVVNYELPNVAEAYVHRIGRTGRAGASGHAISLCDPSEHGLLRDIERLIGQRLVAPGDLPKPASAKPAHGKGANGPANRKGGRGRPTGKPTGARPHRGRQAA